LPLGVSPGYVSPIPYMSSIIATVAITLFLAEPTPPGAQIVTEVLKVVASAITVGLLGLLSRPVRGLLFFRRTEYDFDYDAQDGAATWDIQWEDFRLTIKVEDVHNDHLDKVTFLKNKVKPGEQLDVLKVSDKFHKLFDGDIELKLNSVIRVKSKSSTAPKRYILRFVLRRRR
jgi:hypothetical protein